jgi:hypothetical protein
VFQSSELVPDADDCSQSFQGKEFNDKKESNETIGTSPITLYLLRQPHNHWTGSLCMLLSAELSSLHYANVFLGNNETHKSEE